MDRAEAQGGRAEEQKGNRDGCYAHRSQALVDLPGRRPRNSAFYLLPEKRTGGACIEAACWRLFCSQRWPLRSTSRCQNGPPSTTGALRQLLSARICERRLPSSSASLMTSQPARLLPRAKPRSSPAPVPCPSFPTTCPCSSSAQDHRRGGWNFQPLPQGRQRHVQPRATGLEPACAASGGERRRVAGGGRYHRRREGRSHRRRQEW